MPRSCRPRAQFSVKGEPHGPEMWLGGWRLRKACVGRLWRKRRPNLSEPVKCSQHLTGFRWCSVRSAVWQPAKPLRAFCRCSRASNDTGAPCNPIRGRAAGWCARSEEGTCSMLRAFSRSRGRNVPASASRWSYSSSMLLLRLQPSLVVHMVRRGKAVASRFGGPPCSAWDLSKRFWSYAGSFF